MKANVLKFAFIIGATSLFTVAVQAAEQPPQYALCGACHEYGVSGAPKTGDAAQWEPRLAKGMDALVASIKQGVAPYMPPYGGCANCTDEDFKALVKYMSTPR
jgi:cytochrome c5